MLRTLLPCFAVLAACTPSPQETTMRNPGPVPLTAARESSETLWRSGFDPGAGVPSRKPCSGSAGGLARRGPGAPNLVYRLRQGGSRRTSDGGAAQRRNDSSSRRGHAPQGLLRRASARWLSRHPILRRIRRRRGGPAWRRAGSRRAQSSGSQPGRGGAQPLRARIAATYRWGCRLLARCERGVQPFVKAQPLGKRGGVEWPSGSRTGPRLALAGHTAGARQFVVPSCGSAPRRFSCARSSTLRRHPPAVQPLSSFHNRWLRRLCKRYWLA